MTTATFPDSGQVVRSQHSNDQQGCTEPCRLTKPGGHIAEDSEKTIRAENSPGEEKTPNNPAEKKASQVAPFGAERSDEPLENKIK